MNTRRMAIAFLVVLATPYVFGRLIPDNFAVIVILQMVGLPLLFGWYAKQYCNAGEIPLLVAAGAVPFANTGIFLALTKGQHPIPPFAASVIPWIFFAALGYQLSARKIGKKSPVQSRD